MLENPQFNPKSRERLEQQMAFLLEADRLKHVLRRSLLIEDRRRENSAEHSWHAALAALVLSEHANVSVDLPRVLKMLILHDVVEIDAGDTFVYDADGQAGKEERERVAAHRLFGLLPEDLGREFMGLWEEFEAFESPEARFAQAIDRLLPMLHNFHTQGQSWKQHGIWRGRVVDYNQHMQHGSEPLWDYAKGLIETAVEKGYLPENAPGS